MKKTGVVVGRFQTAEVSDELRSLIAEIQRENEKVIIVLGVTKVLGSKINPFDETLRKIVLSEAFPGVKIVSLEDHPSDDVWSRNLDNIILAATTGPVTLYGSAEGLEHRYKGRFAVVRKGTRVLPEIADLSAYRSHHGHSPDFRKGILFGLSNMYPKVYPTVDMALFRNNRAEILLGYKAVDKRWRLPGGFVDPTDNSYEDAVCRELMEETGIKNVAGLLYERSFRLNDWRYRDEPDGIMTCLFSAEYVSGEPVGSDDIAVVNWFKLSDVRDLLGRSEVVPEHIALIQFLLQRYLR
jgi:bifunctional NMN adenylyltransferase/nudix hydrolase